MLAHQKKDKAIPSWTDITRKFGILLGTPSLLTLLRKTTTSKGKGRKY
jgi:hypothetical protein